MQLARFPKLKKTMVYALSLMSWLTPSGAFCEPFEIKAGLGPVFATEFSKTKRDGIGAAVYVELGLTDLFNAQLSALHARHLIGSGYFYSLSGASLGLSINLDVLALVPYLSARFGFYHQSFDSHTTSNLGMVISLGGDYLVTDYFTVGLAFEYHGLLTGLNGLPAYLAITSRIGYRWLDW